MKGLIDFEMLESNLDKFKLDFSTAKPFEYLVVDGFCDEDLLNEALNAIPDASSNNVNRSRDFIFAKNKFEKSKFDEISDEFKQLKADILSDRFRGFLNQLTEQDIFVDPEFHGGGLHQGGNGSFLNMHADFNYHPNHRDWFRNINILLYLNKDWKKEYRGELRLQDGRVESGKIFEIEPVFNRAVIMYTRDYTLQGYQEINFPQGTYRRSIAAYGYTIQEPTEEARTTVWYPEGSWFRKVLGKHMPKLVKLKSKLIGSSTGKNR